MAPIHLPIREVAEAAKRAYDEKRLSAQVTSYQERCAYRDRNSAPCAIGAALDDAVAADFDRAGRFGKSAGVHTLLTEGLVTTDDPDALKRLQDAHDRWAHAQGEGLDRLETHFLSVLNSILARA